MSVNLSASQIKILALYTLRLSGGILPEEALIDILASCEVNGLMLTDAITSLVEDGHIRSYPDDGTTYLRISDTGRVIATELDREVPVSLRVRVAERTVAEVAAQRNKASIDCHVEEHDDGYTVNASLSDEGNTLFSFSVFTPTRFQADVIAKKFISTPLETYRNIISVLTEEKESLHE